MSVKSNGAEFKKFWNDERFWGMAWTDGECINVNKTDMEEGSFDPDTLKDTDVVVLSGGEMNDTGDATTPSTETFFKRWRKQQSSRTIMVTVPAERLDAVIEMLKLTGLEVS